MKLQKFQQNIVMPSTCSCEASFMQIIQKISIDKTHSELLESANEFFGLKHYNIFSLTLQKVKSIAKSLCKKADRTRLPNHSNIWMEKELKIFVWMVICQFGIQIQNLVFCDNLWLNKYSQAFHNKNIELLTYQIKLIACNRSQRKKWSSQQERLLIGKVIIKLTKY